MSQVSPISESVSAVAPKKRNNVLDLLRGHFLLSILITHYYKFPSPFIFYFGRGEMWVSSAPGFVFISGLILGMTSKKKLLAEGFKPAAKRLFLRGFKLYVLSVIFTVGYTVAALHIGRWQDLNYGFLNASFWEVLWKTLLLQYSYGWADLLTYYSIMLMFVAPVVVWFLHRNWWKPLLGISTAIWLIYYFFHGNFKLTGSYLPVEAWQFLFVLAMMIGHYKEKLAPVYRKYFYGEKKRTFLSVFFAGIILTVGLSIADRFYDLFPQNIETIVDKLLVKRELGPGLLVMFFYWFTALYYIFQRFEGLITKYLGWLFLTFGRNSLLTYSVQSVFLFVQFYLPIQVTYWWNTLSTIALILLVWLSVKFILLVEKVIKQHGNALPRI